MKNALLISLSSLLFVLDVSAKSLAEEFAGSDRMMDRSEAAYYVIYRDKLTLDNIVPKVQFPITNDAIINSERVNERLEALIIKSEGRLGVVSKGKPPEWKTSPWQIVAEVDRPAPKASIPGVTEEKIVSEKNKVSVGPIRLRRNSSELTPKLKDAKGSSISYSANHNKNNEESWNGEGILYLPFVADEFLNASQTLTVGPSAGWKFAKYDAASQTDIKEVTFGVPIIYEKGMDHGRYAFSKIEPYMQTDMSGGHEIWGSSLTFEYTGDAPVFALRWLNLGGYNSIARSPVDYQLRLIPKLDYSVTSKTGKYSARSADDDWFRAGATISIDLRMPIPIDIGASYGFLETLDGSGGFSSQYSFRITGWLNDYIGITAERTRGEMPISLKEVDLTTVGVEIKY